jgi:membrane-associated phospholipid phosphatase
MLTALDPSQIDGDRNWFLDVNEWAQDTGWLHGPLNFYAKYGVVLFAALLLIGYLLARRRRGPVMIAAALWAPLATLVAVAVNQPMASAVDEPRPFTVFPHALVLAHRSTDPSFASDHATLAGAVTIGLLLVSWRLGAVAAVAALLMAFARVYVGAHFPIDVIAGLVLGAGIAGLGWLIARPVLVRLVMGLARTPLRPLVESGSRKT